MCERDRGKGRVQPFTACRRRRCNNAARARLTGAQRAPGWERNAQQSVAIAACSNTTFVRESTACSAPTLSFSCLSSPPLLVPSGSATPRIFLSFPFSFPSGFFRSRIQPNLYKCRKIMPPTPAPPCPPPSPPKRIFKPRGPWPYLHRDPPRTTTAF